MKTGKAVRVAIAGAGMFMGTGAAGQFTAPGGPQGPDSTGKCWMNVPKTYQDLSFIEKIAFKAACKKNPNACDTSLFGTKKVAAPCPAPPKPTAATESKPAPAAPAVAAKETCPQGMQLGTDENGKHLCSDGVHTSEPKKFTPLPSSTPAPVNASPAPAAR
jgi:hypothetical protein